MPASIQIPIVQVTIVPLAIAGIDPHDVPPSQQGHCRSPNQDGDYDHE
jgi:hypothetical protein